MGNCFCSPNLKNCCELITCEEKNENFSFYLAYFQSFREGIVAATYNFPSIKPPKFLHFYKSSKFKEPVKIAKDYSASRAVRPISCIEYIFLPEFKNIKYHNKDYGNFKTLELISKGAFGKVYKVKDEKSQKIFAMKILEKSQIIEDNAVIQVKDEINIQKMCGHHQFIVRYLCAWQIRTQLFIVSEFKSGGELLNLLSKYGSLSENIVRIYVAEIALAIDFLHHAGVIYRDLKPENILLDEEGHISLTDFGLSKWLSLGSRTNTICGTLYYMAPEILNNQPYTHAVDWWSLGVLSCRLLTNEYPVRNDDKTVQLPNRVQLNDPSKDLLRRLLEYEPTNRLSALYALKRIAFFKDFNFEDVLSRNVHPREMLAEYEKIKQDEQAYNLFENFDDNS